MTITKTQKIILYSLGGAISAAFIYYVYNFVRLQEIYKRTASLDQAMLDIKNPNTPLIEFPDSELDLALDNGLNEASGMYSGNDNLEDTATINGIKFTLEDNGTYTSTDGNNSVFNPSDNSLTTSDGNSTTIAPSDVIYSKSGNP